jgi:hypothetical protein
MDIPGLDHNQLIEVALKNVIKMVMRNEKVSDGAKEILAVLLAADPATFILAPMSASTPEMLSDRHSKQLSFTDKMGQHHLIAFY